MADNRWTAFPFIIVAFFVALHVILFARYGGYLLDDAVHYVDAGHLLLKTGKIDDHFHVFYLVPIALLSAFIKLFGDPGLPFIVFQSTVALIALIPLYRMVCRIHSAFAAAMAVTIVVLWIDNLRWNVLVMTESLFGSLVIFTFSNLAFYDSTLRRYAILLVLIVAAMFTRPTGLLLAVSVLTFVIYANRAWITRSWTRLLTLSVMLILAVTGVVVLMSFTWDFTDQLFRGNIITYADSYSGDTRFIRIDPQYADGSGAVPIVKMIRFAWHRPLHVMITSVMKVFYLLTGVRPYYSWTHNLMSIAWMTVIYIGAVIGYRSMRPSAFRMALLALIAGNIILVAGSSVDWDNRFYIPMEIPFAVLSAIGWTSMLRPDRRLRGRGRI